MANYATLKAAIAAAIKQNGNNEITGNLLQQQLLAMVNSLGANYQYAGIATPATNPGTPDQNVFYIASTPGAYTNFNNVYIKNGEIAILKYNGGWSVETTGASTIKWVNENKFKFYFNSFNIIKSIDGLGETVVALTNVKLINGRKYRIRIETAVPYTPTENTTIKIMSESSLSSIKQVAQLQNIEVSDNIFSFTWDLATGENYRLGFYSQNAQSSPSSINVSLYEDFVPISYVGEIVPYFGSYIDITPTSIFIPDNSRMIVGGKYIRTYENITLNKSDSDQSGVVLYNIHNGNFRYSATAAYEYIDGDYILFTIGYGERICSLPLTYYTYNGESVFSQFVSDNELTRIAYIAGTGAAKINITDTEIVIPAYLRIIYGGGNVYRLMEPVNIQRVAPSTSGTQTEYILFNPSNNEITTIAENEISAQTIGEKYILFNVANGLTGCTLSFNEYTYNGESPILPAVKNVKNIVTQNKHKESALVNTALYNGNESIKNSNKISILHLTDIHGDTTNIGRIIEYFNEYLQFLDFSIHTGDSVSNVITDPNPFEQVDGGNTILNVAGNHEAWLQTSDNDYFATEKQVYDKIFANNIASWGVVQPQDAATLGKCYYYKDVRNFRLIVLDSTHWHTGGNAHITDDASVQKAWFESVLADAITNNKMVICALHYPPVNGLDIVRNVDGFNTLAAQKATDPVIIGDGWFAQDEIFGCVDTFKTNGGKFVCWIAGHTHMDYFGLVHGHQNQLFVVLSSSGQKSSPQGANIPGTNAQDNFNIITLSFISNAEMIIKIVRIGNDYDIYNRHKNTLCYNVIDGSIISVN